MKYPSRRNSKRSKITSTVAITCVVILLGLLLPWLFTSVSRLVLTPFHLVHTWYNDSNAPLPMFLRDRSALVDQITALENELAIAGVTDLTTQRLFNENMWLRELLGAPSEKRIAAAVIARPNQLPYDLLQIDRGSMKGIVLGAPVYIGLDAVIGTVVSVSEQYAFVQLFTHPDFRATAFISGANIVAPLEGYGGGVARVRVPQGIALTIGSVVHLPSIHPGAFGKIAWIENDPSQPEQYGYIVLPESIQAIQYVAVAPNTVPTSEAPILEERIQTLINSQFVASTTPLVATTTDMVATSSPDISSPAAVLVPPPQTATTSL